MKQFLISVGPPGPHLQNEGDSGWGKKWKEQKGDLFLSTVDSVVKYFSMQRQMSPVVGQRVSFKPDLCKAMVGHMENNWAPTVG